MLLPFLFLLQDGVPMPEGYVEHATEVRIGIGADGSPKDCTLTKSSGSAKLDEQVCPIMMKRAKFKPKMDANGVPIESSFTTTIRWRLPKEAPKP